MSGFGLVSPHWVRNVSVLVASPRCEMHPVCDAVEFVVEQARPSRSTWPSSNRRSRSGNASGSSPGSWPWSAAACVTWTGSRSTATTATTRSPWRPHDITQGANNLLAENGHVQVRAVDEVFVRMPTPEEVRRLELAPGTPVAFHILTGYGPDDEPIRRVLNVLPGDRHVILFDRPGLPVPDGDE